MKDLSVVVVNYNGISTVLETIESIYRLEGVRPSIILIDDGSTDGSLEAVKERFPEVEIHAEPANTKRLNRLRNKGLRLARSKYVLLTDNDIVFDSRFALEMLSAFEADDRVAVCLPRLMDSVEKTRIFHIGGKVHYVGTTVKIKADVSDERERIDLEQGDPYLSVGGGIGLFDRSKLERVGWFDEDYALAWGDDGELHQRFLLAGFRCLLVPRAFCFHEFKPFGKTRHYRARGQLHNRWRYLLTHHSARTLVLIAPALVFYELVQMGFYLLKGIPHVYVQGSFDAIRRLPEILRRRKEVQAMRAVPDRELVVAGPIYLLAGGGMAGRAVAVTVMLISAVLTVYWKLVSPLLSGARRLTPSLEGEQA